MSKPIPVILWEKIKRLFWPYRPQVLPLDFGAPLPTPPKKMFFSTFQMILGKKNYKDFFLYVGFEDEPNSTLTFAS